MRATKHVVKLVTLVVLAIPFRLFGIVGLSIERQGTNIVISWPSEGHELYLIQYRATLDPSTPWTTFANNYPATGNNRTTFILFGAAAPCSDDGGDPSEASEKTEPSEPMVAPKDDAKAAVPLVIYPPGIDLPGHIIIWPDGSTDDWSDDLVEKWRAMQQEEGGAQTEDSGGESTVDSAFFRVFHIPDWAFNVTNYSYDGPTLFPVDFKDYRDMVAHIEVLLNGEPCPHAEFTTHVSGGQTNWGMGIYFDHLTNGTYQIQLVTTLWLNEEIGDNSIFLSLTNLARPIAVFNQVTFPDWNDFIQGDTYTFNAQLANPDTDWWIDVYDWQWNYVNTGSGHTTNGLVSWTWDLYDWLGNNRDDFDTDPYFFAEITFNSLGDGPQITRPTRPPVKGYPDRGEWLIAFQDRWYSDAPGYPADLQVKYEEAVQAIRGGPLLIGDTAWWHPLKFGTNVYTQAEREQSWANLLAWIGDLYVRNFYYHGHGGATGIGCDRHTLGTNGLITGSAFSYRGSRSTMESWQVSRKTKYNRYWFVFLDGCSTAAGNWPNAFNISKVEREGTDFYENHPKHPRPSVFVGWNQEIGGEGWGSAYGRHEFQAYWMGNWVNDADRPGIKEALRRANVGAGWISQQKLDSALRVYGYVNMKARDYNRKNDWRWP